MRRFLVQPDPGGRISGGYLYNQRMAGAGSGLELVSVAADPVSALREVDARAGDVVVADSLFLHADRLAPFTALRARGVRVGMLLHALPSFLDRAAVGLASEAPSDGERVLLAGLDFLIVPGPFLRDLLGPIVPLPIHVCPPGIDDEWRAATPAGADIATLSILSVGAVTPGKGFDDVVAALASLAPAPAFSWTIAGSLDVDPVHVAWLRRRIDDAGLGGAVRLCGQIPVEETRALYAAAHVFALASHSENHPLTAMEAVASCVPTVAYRVGGMSAIIVHGVTGLLAPPRDVGALAAHLGRLLRDGGARRAMAMACEEHRDALPTWREAARSMAAALDAEQGPGSRAS